MTESLMELLHGGAAEEPAILAPDLPALSFNRLIEQCHHVADWLNVHGLGRGDRVAIVLPNGPEMASSFLSIACGATTAPLNPSYRLPEFEFYLSDMGAKAVVVESGVETVAREAAHKLGIAVLELHLDVDGPAGTFQLAGPNCRSGAKTGPSEADDIALILHTSGTTSPPKIVPLTHGNLVASARNVAVSLQLTEKDRCLNVMPLFHIHGLVAALLASLGAGGSTFCTPGFNALKFFGWLAQARSTWYTAVPTMHQALLQRAHQSRSIIEANPLRFIRSSSAALPATVMRELEETFRAPVIEAYAMTEAAHQITSNPLPPRQRKPGTVGVAAGPDVSVMDDTGRLLESGEIGEIVICGDNVTAGYEKSPEANKQNWMNGWFHTGDQGFMDEDGYVRLTGRFNEFINRGGAKVSPKEIDDILIEHPAIAQVLTFGIPHPKLGEQVGVAVVLVEGRQTDEAGVKAFASERLARFKVPERVVFMEQIPRGATGKPQRIGLAEKLGLWS